MGSPATSGGVFGIKLQMKSSVRNPVPSTGKKRECSLGLHETPLLGSKSSN
jgi:hypothetical protein